MKKKRRLRSVILISAVSAVACGGQAEDNSRDGPQETGDGDGDDTYIGDPVGLPPDGSGGYLIGGSGGQFVGVPPGTGGGPVGTGGWLIGTGGGPVGQPPQLGGMGGAPEQSTGGATVGVPIR